MAQDRSSNVMNSSNNVLKSVPIPARRKVQSSNDISNGITYRRSKPAHQSKSDAETELAKMNDEILRYRKNIQVTPAVVKPDNRPDRVGEENQEEIQSLKLQLQDVLEKNNNWQSYNNQREEYVRSLHQKYNELHHQYHQAQESLSQPNNPDQLAEQQRRYFDGLLVQARKELAQSEEENAKIKAMNNEPKRMFENEVAKLKKDLEHWKIKYDNEREVSICFREKYEAERHKTKSSDTNKENWNQISMLRREMEVSRKDFSTERKRREDIERRLYHLQMKVKHSEMNFTKKHENLYEYEQDYVIDRKLNKHSTHSVSPPKIKKISGVVDIMSKSNKDRKSYPTERIHGSARTERIKKAKTSRTEKPHTSRTCQKLNQTYNEYGRFDEDTNLQCPNCGKVYMVDEHEFLLIHIDSCV